MDQIVFNSEMHDKYSSCYDSVHPDIFNSIEQKRISLLIDSILLSRNQSNLLALDFGCGTGNISSHLVSKHICTVSADVSAINLKTLSQNLRTSSHFITPILIDGSTNTQLMHFKFDIIYIYSVLHHIPDYLSVLSLLAKLLKPEGLLIVDHEASASSWQTAKELKNQDYLLADPFLAFSNKFRSAASYRKLSSMIIRKFIKPRFQIDGDIHVWPDDHIKWEDIHSTLINVNMSQIYSNEYLVYKNYYDREKYLNIVKGSHYSDMAVAIYKMKSLSIDL